MKLKFPFFISILLMQFGLYGQNGILGDGFANGWNNPDNAICFSNGAGNSRIGIFQPNDENGDKFFRLVTCWVGNENQWGPDVDGAIMVISQEFTAYAQRDFNAFQLENADVNYNYVFKTRAGGNPPNPLGFIVFEVQGDIRTISSITQSLDDGNVFFDEEVTVTANLDANLNTGQAVYLRYSSDGFSNSTVVNMTGSGNTYSATIPSNINAEGETISYYVFTSGTDASNNPLTITHDDADFFTINLNNNSGLNYSYTVRSEYITQTGATDWNNASSWRANQVPPAGADVIIAHDLNLTDNREVQNLTINSGATLTFSNDETLDIQDSGSFTNNGTINHANGILNFLGGGSILGTLSLNDVILNSSDDGVSFGQNCTIEGSLLLNPGGFVNSDSPIYGSASTLIYNIGGDYNRNSEWSNPNPIQGNPANVLIQNTNLNLNANNVEEAVITGNMTIENESSLNMTNNTEKPLIVGGNFLNNGSISLSGEIGGDLKVFGDFTNNGTFNFNNRALFFEGNEIQELNASTVFEIPFLVIAKNGGEVTLNQNIIINGVGDGLQMSDQAVLNLNGNQLQIGNDTGTGVLFNDNSALKGSTNSKVVFKSTANTGDLRFVQSDFGNYLSEFEMDGSGNIGVSDTLNILRKFHLKDGNFNAGGNLTFKSSDSITAIIPEVIDGTINGDVRIERYFSNIKRSFRYVSSPINSTDNIHANWQEGVNNSNTSDNENPHPGFGIHITGSQNGDNGFDATQTGNPSMFTWDAQSQMWNSIPNTNNTNLLLGKAYALMVRGDRSTDLNSNNAIGAPTVLRSLGTIQTGQYSVPAEEMPNAADEFALIGNPYQAQVDVTQLNKNGLNPNYIYIWDPNLGDQFGGYTAVDLSDVNNISSTPNSEANELLQPSQAFFFETNAATSSVTFEEAHKVDNVTNVQTFSITETPQVYVTLKKASAASILDAMRVVFGDAFSNDVTNEDGKKLWNFSEYLAIEKFEKWLSVEKKPLMENDTTQLFMGNYQHQNYQLQLEVSHLEDAEIQLVDQYLETTTLLESGDNTYAFSVDQSNPESTDVRRFQLITEHTSLATQTITRPQITVYPNPVAKGILNLVWPFEAGDNSETQIRLYDIFGKSVFNQNSASSESVLKIDVGTLPTGVYFLKANRGAAQYPTKIIVKSTE